VQQIVAKTDGVPLFVEELTKTVVESGLLAAINDHYELRGPLPPLAIPSTLHASLLARLDRLSTVREIAQLGATLGREFSYELLAAVSPLDEGTLQHGLKQLVEAELVYQRGLVPQAHYLFKHALIQDTAYQSLLKSTRQQSHQQIAQVLEGRFPETVETQPELVAHHYTEAGLKEQAEAAIALCSEQGFTQHGAAGTIHRGWALVELGQGEEGIVQLRQGMAAHLATGAKVFRPYNFSLLAEAYGKVGQAEEGLTVLAEPLLDLVHETGERVAGAELYRLKGQLMLRSQIGLRQVSDKSKTSPNKSEDPDTQHLAPSTQAETEAEACFLKAIEIARQQSAKSWELRASTSLAGLWQQQGKKTEARQMLAEIYNWFSEGFDTKDLQEAKALIEELNH
jgi:hypothetical protein